VPTKQRANRKNEIERRAADLIAEHGYDRTSLRDLADSLQISKGTVLHHFGTKDRLLERVHSTYMSKRLAEAELITKAFPTPPARLAGFIYQLMIVQESDRAATVAFAREIVRFATDDLMDDVRRMRTNYGKLLTDVIQDGITSGDFKPADPRLIALMIFGMCNWSWTWFDPSGRLTPAQIAETFATTLLHGLANEPTASYDPQETARIVSETISAVAARRQD
jgi:AcrR family transcriptional regulator